MQFVTKQTAGDDLDSTFMPFDLTGFAVENGSPFFLGCENRTKYVYDANGNRTTFVDVENGTVTTGTHDDQDRVLSYGNLAYTYTRDGALRTKTDTSTGEVTTYTYDALGNLTHVDLPDGRGIQYLVDGSQRRVVRVVDGVLERAWLYRDDLRVVAELDGAGTVTKRFVWADGTGADDDAVGKALTRLGLRTSDLLRELLTSVRAEPARANAPAYMLEGGLLYRIVSDHLGTPRLVMDVATGAIAQRFDVDEWGVVTMDTNPGFVPFGFAGGLYDGATMLTRFGARDYDAQIGRWTLKDPIFFAGASLNLYLFGRGDPINNSDSNGLHIDETCREVCLAGHFEEFETCADEKCAGTAKPSKERDECLLFPTSLTGKPSGQECMERLSEVQIQCSQECDPHQHEEEEIIDKIREGLFGCL